jgi:L-alanine-DL-glutamate epimerase-like enolase superfamily enzyme
VIPPERVESWAAIRSASRVPLATGEHVYTRWQVKELLVNGAVDYVQTDPDWTGGITEQVKICDLASSFNIPVIAHGHSLMPALHIAAAQSPASGADGRVPGEFTVDQAGAVRRYGCSGAGPDPAARHAGPGTGH